MQHRLDSSMLTINTHHLGFRNNRRPRQPQHTCHHSSRLQHTRHHSSRLPRQPQHTWHRSNRLLRRPQHTCIRLQRRHHIIIIPQHRMLGRTCLPLAWDSMTSMYGGFLTRTASTCVHSLEIKRICSTGVTESVTTSPLEMLNDVTCSTTASDGHPKCQLSSCSPGDVGLLMDGNWDAIFTPSYANSWA